MEEANSLFQRFLRTYRKDEVIFEQDAEGKEMFIIHQGKVRIIYKTPQGVESILTVMSPGEFFGEMTLIDDSVRSASAVADEDDTQLIVLDKPKFTYMVQQLPDFSLAIMKKLCQSIRVTNIQRVEQDNV